MRLLIRTVGYRKTFKFATVIAERGQNAAGSYQLASIEEGFSLAVRNHPWRGNCLSRSLTLYTVLRAQNHAASLNVGIRPGRNSLDAHAWVKLDGKSLSHDGVLGDKFQLLGTLAN